MEIYEIKTAFSSALIVRSRTLYGDENNPEKIVPMSDSIPSIRTYPSELCDLDVDCPHGYPLSLAIYSVGLFMSSVLGYPSGEYQIKTSEGVKTVALCGKGRAPCLYLNDNGQITEYYYESREGNISFYDGEIEDKCYRIVICDNAKNFDIQSAGAAILRLNTNSSSPVSVVAISGEEESYCLRIRNNCPTAERNYDPRLFAVVGKLLYDKTDYSAELGLETHQGKVVMKRSNGGFYIASLNPTVKRIFG